MLHRIPNGAGEQFRRRKDFDFRRLAAQRHRIAYDEFSQLRAFHVVIRFARQHRVGTYSADGFCTLFHECVGGFAECACGVHHVVHQDHVGAFYVTDDGHGGYFVGFCAVFIADHQFAAELLGINSGAFHTTHVGAGKDGIGEVLFGQKRHVNCFGPQVVHRDIEKALHLVGVQVHRHDAVGAGSGEHVRHEFGADRHTGFVFAVLPGIAEVWHDGRDVACGGAFGSIDPEQEFDQVVVRLTGTLNKKGEGAAHALVDDRLHFAVAEPGERFVAERCVEMESDFFC